MQADPPNSKRHIALAAALLALMAILMFQSAWDDTPNADEIVTVVSGYSHLVKKEYRFDIGNPPLIDDLGALPLLFLKLNQPWAGKSWGPVMAESDPDILGREFLYHSGNDADRITRLSRVPMILFTIAFGGLLFWWTRKNYGDAVALLTLFLYAFSPTILTHGRFVTTDLGAAAGFFVGTIVFLRFLKNPSWGNTALAGFAMGFALLTKYSTVALIPVALILAVAWAVAHPAPAGRNVFRYLAQTAVIIAIAFVVIYPLYLHHIWNYSPENQVSMAQFNRDNYGMHGTAKDIVIWASDKAVLRPWAQYFLGLLATLKASGWGQGLYFLGNIYPTGMRIYFPFVYLIKEPLALHLLTLVALLFALSGFRWPTFRGTLLAQRGREWLARHFTEFALLLVLGVYWSALIRSNINIGVRHLLPAFPFTFVLVSQQIPPLFHKMQTRAFAKWGSRLALGALLAWQTVSVLRVHPSYMAYFNELAGGPDGGWRYVNDSNLDWGQDVKRLAQFVERRGIDGIHVDYFGPADARYYLKGRYLGPVGCSELPKGWLAVSAMVYPGSPWNPTCDYRSRLPLDKLVAKVGYSIFIFHAD